MNRFIVLFILANFMLGCSTGQQISSLRGGESKEEVQKILGRPDGYRRDGSTEFLTYSGRVVPWTGERADYHVELVNGHVSSYGQGAVRNVSPNTLYVVPLR